MYDREEASSSAARDVFVGFGRGIGRHEGAGDSGPTGVAEGDEVLGYRL